MNLVGRQLSTKPVRRAEKTRKLRRKSYPGNGVRSLQMESLESRVLLALNPTAEETEFMQLINGFRTDPHGEFSRLIVSNSPIRARDPSLQDDLNFANVNANTLRGELRALTPTHPVAWNEAIRDFTVAHNAQMVASKSQFHSNTIQRRQALLDAGVDLRIVAGEVINSENVFGFGKSPLHIFAAYVIDWQQGGPGGMIAGRPHRRAIINPDFEQAGHAISSAGGGFGPRVNSQVLANIENPPVMVTGAIFEDDNNSRRYDAGEGLSSVQFVFEGEAGTFRTTGFSHGGYQIELPPGIYAATATGGGMRYTQRMANIVVGNVNVWKNWIYDPDVIPPDALENNNTVAIATPLDGTNQSFSALSIHNGSDQDFFKLVPLGSGTLQVDLQFSHAAGDVDVQVRNAAGTVLASSLSTTDHESLTLAVVRDASYFVRVFGKNAATHGSYRISISPPPAAPPIANSDRAIFNASPDPIAIDVLANDVDPDGSETLLIPQLVPGSHSAFEVDARRQVRYTAPENFSGVHRADYTVVDDQNLVSAPATVAVFVVNFALPIPWQNPDFAFDVNDDGVTSPLDALLVINELNQRSSRQLPSTRAGAEEIWGFVDVSGDGFVTPLDALLVINQNNINGNGEGELRAPQTDQRSRWETSADEALLQMASAHSYDWCQEELRKKYLF